MAWAVWGAGLIWLLLIVVLVSRRRRSSNICDLTDRDEAIARSLVAAMLLMAACTRA
jgi:hypothetical protein